MGYLAAKDLGTLNVDASGNTFDGDVNNLTGAKNPTDNNGITNLRLFNLSFNSGKAIDARGNISGRTTRLAQGSTNAVNLTLSAKFERKFDRGDLQDLTPDELKVRLNLEGIEAMRFLGFWSRNRTIIMLFWYPNLPGTTDLYFGQDPDFYGSSLKMMYDVLWDNDSTSSEQGFQGTNYGTIHYDPAADGSAICAIPVIFESINVTETPDSKFINVTIQGYAVENEGVN